MLKVRPLLPLSIILLSLACGVASQVVPTIQSSIPIETTLIADTPTSSATATLVPFASSTLTQPVATIPSFLTLTPGIGATLTAAYSTPGAVNTLAAQQTMVAATQSVLMPQLSSSLLTQCPNPSDPPMKNWVNIPVMPQATAGQVVQTLIGSYYCFRAPVTVVEMETFYKENLTAPGWEMQSDINGSMVFIGFSQAGIQTLFIVSGPGNKNDLIVAVNVTVPISNPTAKP